METIVTMIHLNSFEVNNPVVNMEKYDDFTDTKNNCQVENNWHEWSRPSRIFLIKFHRLNLSMFSHWENYVWNSYSSQVLTQDVNNNFMWIYDRIFELKKDLNAARI